MTAIIEARNISKQYQIGRRRDGYVALRDIIGGALQHPLAFLGSKAKGLFASRKEDFFALDDVGFTVQKGEVVGIIGSNGAGKSTLLKILTQITPPSTGEIILRGKVSSLLEVGTGFHPELTGRENVFLNGAILGMTKKEIVKKFDDIVDFSGVRQFIDTPVKRYSSGMYVRLAFAIAAHMEPDILLVDEVLAVGDAEFQKKCLGKMDEVAKTTGRTILFVSHNMSAIKKLCTRAILLDKGKVIYDGSTDRAVEMYLNSEYRLQDENSKLFPLDAKDIVVREFSVSQKGNRTNYVDNDDSFDISVEFDATKDLTAFRIGAYVKNAAGDTIVRSFTPDWNSARETVAKGKYRAALSFPGKTLMPGNYIVLLHASCFAKVDYLGKYNITKSISVSRPIEFNQAHSTELIEGPLMMGNEWAITRLG